MNQMYRIGKKQKRAILTADGNEVVVFPKGKEALAEKVCNLLNAELEVNKISANPDVRRSFHLSKLEEDLFAKSGSKRIMFELGGGIGYGVHYENKKGKWVDITDVSDW